MFDMNNPMFHLHAENAIGYTQRMLERGMRLTQAQFAVAEKVAQELSREYRELVTLKEPAGILKGMPNALSGATRVAAEGTREMMANLVAYQTDLMQLSQATLPQWHKQMIENMTQAVTAVAAMSRQPVGRWMSPQFGGQESGGAALKKVA